VKTNALKWCAECLFDLRGLNPSLAQFTSDPQMFAMLESDPEGYKSADGRHLHPRAVTMWQGTPLCMDHFRILRREQQGR